MANVIQWRIINFISIWQTVDFLCEKVNKDMMTSLKAMSVGMWIAASSLKIFSTNQTSINIQIRQGNWAELLKIKIQNLHG